MPTNGVPISQMCAVKLKGLFTKFIVKHCGRMIGDRDKMGRRNVWEHVNVVKCRLHEKFPKGRQNYLSKIRPKLHLKVSLNFAEIWIRSVIGKNVG